MCVCIHHEVMVNFQTNIFTPFSPRPPQVNVPAGKVSPKEEERKDESPASWRLGLRKTGSYGALAEISAVKEAQKEKDPTGVMRSASSPRLTSSLDNKDKEKVCDAQRPRPPPLRHKGHTSFTENSGCIYERIL